MHSLLFPLHYLTTHALFNPFTLNSTPTPTTSFFSHVSTIFPLMFLFFKLGYKIVEFHMCFHTPFLLVNLPSSSPGFSTFPHPSLLKHFLPPIILIHCFCFAHIILTLSFSGAPTNAPFYIRGFHLYSK